MRSAPVRQARQRQNTIGSLLRQLVVGAGCLLTGHASWAAAEGVRHRIDAVVSVEPGSSLFGKSPDVKGFLAIYVRISANSRETRFFGTLTPTFSDIAIPKDPKVLVAQTKIWEEDKCHQRRGLPKVTVTRLMGSFGQGQDMVEVASTIRTWGLRVPPDELTPGIKRPSGTDDIGEYHEFRGRTKDSRLNVDLKVYTFACRL